MQTIVLATHNQGKVAELRALLKDFPYTILGLDSFPQVGEIPEPGASFEENALHKAGTVCRATGLIAVADDSGLVVDALDGAPGILSARYSDPDATPDKNNAKLLRELDGVPLSRRTARFVCVMAAQAPGGAAITARGVWEGFVAPAPSGKSGFGYDPVFFDPQAGMTAAEMEPAAKNRRSHRGKALQALLADWPVFLSRMDLT